jgi:hypothetical protein
MQLKCLIRRGALFLGILALISITAVGQENRSEISIEGTGFVTKDTGGNGIFQRASETGGCLLGYRYNVRNTSRNRCGWAYYSSWHLPDCCPCGDQVSAAFALWLQLTFGTLHA